MTIVDKKPTFLEWQRKQRNKFRKPAEGYYPGKIIPFDSRDEMQRAIAQQQAFMNQGIYGTPLSSLINSALSNG